MLSLIGNNKVVLVLMPELPTVEGTVIQSFKDRDELVRHLLKHPCDGQDYASDEHIRQLANWIDHAQQVMSHLRGMHNEQTSYTLRPN